MDITVSIIQLCLILIIIGLLLSNWEPPIKDQYTFIILSIFGMFLGYILNCGIYWGFVVAGLVFYKNKLIEEFKLVKESLTELKNEKKRKKENEE